MSEGAVTRWRLLDALDSAPGGALVLVVAAAGYGKSTLLDQWAARSARATVVVRARAEDDAGGVLRAVADALAPVVPAAERLRSLGRRAEVDWACDLLPALMSLAATHAFALAIDDTHVVSSPSARELLSELARSWPAPSVLVLSGRERPPVPLVREPISAPTLILGEHDLDFDPAEVDAFLEAQGPGVSRAELLALTGGWPAGIRLTALLRDADLGGTEITVERYLSAHVLGAFSAHELDYLGYVACLAPATVAQIDLVLRRNDTAELLRSFEQRASPCSPCPGTPMHRWSSTRCSPRCSPPGSSATTRALARSWSRWPSTWRGAPTTSATPSSCSTASVSAMRSARSSTCPPSR